LIKAFLLQQESIHVQLQLEYLHDKISKYYNEVSKYFAMN